jgi:hypothetical protein
MHDLEFKLQPSKYYLLLISLVLIASAIIIATISIPIWSKLLVLCALTSYGGYIVWRYVLLKSKYSIRSLRRHSNASWSLYTHQHIYSAELRGDSTVTSVIAILRFQRANTFFPLSAVVFKDSLAVEEYRRLKVLVQVA